MSEQDQPHDPHRRSGYDPNQPREPAGRSTGGQWSATGSHDGGIPRKVVRDTTGEEAWNFFYNMYRPDGSLAEQVVFNRDRSRILSEFNDAGGAEDWDERHTVIAPDGGKLTFETSGDTQTIYDGEGERQSQTVWTEHGPEAQPFVQKAFVPLVAGGAVAGAAAAQAGRIAAQKTIEAAFVLFTWLSSRNSRDRTAAFSFPVDILQTATSDELRVAVRQLTEEELKDACDKYGDVQGFTDEAAAKARLEPKDWKPSTFGTEVHMRVAHRINGEPPEYGPGKPQDPNFVAEMSTEKVKAAVQADAEAGFKPEAPPRSEPSDPNAKAPRYGQRDTVRVDALENRPDTRTVCVYDIKTGERVLPWARIKEIARSVAKHYPGALRIIIAEIRPRR